MLQEHENHPPNDEKENGNEQVKAPADNLHFTPGPLQFLSIKKEGRAEPLRGGVTLGGAFVFRKKAADINPKTPKINSSADRVLC